MIARGPAIDHRGMTMIELMLALAILAVAGVMISGAFATGLRAWQSGLRSGRAELVARVVLERISSQLRSAVPSPAKRDGADAVAFDAGGGHLRFVTLPGGGLPPTQVSYSLQNGPEGARLVYQEYPWPDKDFFGATRPRREERVVEIADFSVEVVRRLDEPEGGGVVVREWSPADETLPATVLVEIAVLAVDGAEPRRYRSMVHIMAQGEP